MSDTALGDGTAGADGAVALPGPGRPLAVRRPLLGLTRTRVLPSELGTRAGIAALAVITAAVALVVVFASAAPSILVPHSGQAFPSWESGPLNALFGHPSLSDSTTTLAYSGLILIMLGAYGAAILAARALSLRVIVGVIVVINVVLLLGPPLQLNDVFNYLGYARLGALHGLNPYTHVMHGESFDPVYTFSSWRNYRDPYGSLFTALTYPLALMPLPVAYWVLKVATVISSLAFVWVLLRCARQLKLDPRPVLAFVVLNPIFILFEVGAFHNDFFMLVPTLGAVALLLARRDRSAGAVLMLAVAVKFTAILLLPFLLMAARPPERRLRVLAGLVLGAIPMIALSLALFGLSLPNISGQSLMITGFSIPNLLGLVLGLGGSTPMLVRVLNVAVVLVVLWGLRRRDWIGASGWATVALVCSLAWLMPWYVVWALPLAALSSSVALRRTVAVLTVFLVLTFVPETGQFLADHGINPLNTPQGQAAQTYEAKLAGR